MCLRESGAARLLRATLPVAVTVAGLIAIFGSGGGMPAVDPSACCQEPSVSVVPALRTVGVGDSVTFTAIANFTRPPVSYQWRRNGVDIAGATNASYILTGAALGDDGARFTVVLTAANGTASASATLQVSPLPPVVYRDGEFAPSDWTSSARPEPANDGPSAAVSRADSGGNPDSNRAIDYAMTAGPSSIDVLHTALAASYEPATQGPIYAIDAQMDCIRIGAGETTVALLLEQDGRRYRAGAVACGSLWTTVLVQWSLGAADFTLIEGPACATGQACPNFGSSGAPIRFGFASSARVPPGEPAASYRQGVDNWTVSVWRK